jgi:WD40 repeat protein
MRKRRLFVGLLCFLALIGAVGWYISNHFLAPISLQGHDRDITSLSFSPDGAYLASGSRDQTLRVWDHRSKALVFPVIHFSNEVRAVAFSPSGALLAVAACRAPAKPWLGGIKIEHTPDDIEVTIYDSRTGEERATLRRGWVGSLAFSPDGKYLATYGSKLRVRNVADWSQRPSFTSKSEVMTQAIAFSRAGRLLAATAGRGDEIHVWDMEGKKQATLRPPARPLETGITSLAFSPDGLTLVCGLGHGLDGSMEKWEMSGGAWVGSLPVREPVSCLSFSPDGEELAVGQWDSRRPWGRGCLTLFDAQTWKSRRVLRGHSEGVTAVAYSPDGSMIATGDTAGDIRLWPTSRNNQLHID